MANRLLPIFGLASLLMLGACSTSKLSQTDVNDDVYYSVAQAKEAVPVVAQEKKYITNRDAYADEDSYSGYYDDYSVRINRFYRYSPWRSYYDYYDPFYSYNPYGYNRYSPGVRVNVYVGGGYGYGYNPYWGNNYYGNYYGYPYHHNYWGMQSYYNTYPYYGGYYGNNGSYYGGMGRDVQSSPNYRPRPMRDFENAPNRSGRTSTPNGTGSVRDNSGTITDTRSRTERYNDENRVSPPSSTGSRTSSTRPPRSIESERPARTSSAPPRTSDDSRTSSRPTRIEPSTPSPSYTPEPSSSGRSDSGSSSGSSSSGRPSRGN